MDFIAFDFETANRNLSSPCALGYVVVVDNLIKYCDSILINPQTEFEGRNINIHGITPNMVKNCDTFPDVWLKIKDLFCKYPLVAHNVSTDKNILEQTLQRYSIPIPHNLTYYCTYRLSRENLPTLSNHRLPTVSEYFNIDLCNHHACDEDALACANIMIELLKNPKFNIYPYVPQSSYSNNNSKSNNYYAKLNQPPALQKSSLKCDDTTICFCNRSFCITGVIENYTKDEVENFIVKKGGKCVSFPSSKTDYLIVGLQNKNLITNAEEVKSGKIIHAEQLRAKGVDIKYISYEHFLSIMEDNYVHR